MTRLHYLAARNPKKLRFKELSAPAKKVLKDNLRYPERSDGYWFPVPRHIDVPYNPEYVYRISSKLRPKGIAPEDDPDGKRIL